MCRFVDPKSNEEGQALTANNMEQLLHHPCLFWVEAGSTPTQNQGLSIVNNIIFCRAHCLYFWK